MHIGHQMNQNSSRLDLGKLRGLPFKNVHGSTDGMDNVIRREVGEDADGANPDFGQ